MLLLIGVHFGIVCEAFRGIHKLTHLVKGGGLLRSSLVTPSVTSSPFSRIRTSSAQNNVDKVLILSECEAKTKTLRRLFNALPSHYLDKYNFTVLTCPESLVVLSMNKRSPRPSAMGVVDFGVARDMILNPKYDVKHGKQVTSFLDMMKKEMSMNISRLIFAFDVDSFGEMLGWELTQVLNIPHKTSTSLMRLPELTFDLFENSLQETLSRGRSCTSGQLNVKLIKKQLTQHIVDRTISFSLSQAIHKCLGDYFSGGRVLSYALNRIVQVLPRFGVVRLQI